MHCLAGLALAAVPASLVVPVHRVDSMKKDALETFDFLELSSMLSLQCNQMAVTPIHFAFQSKFSVHGLLQI